MPATAVQPTHDVVVLGGGSGGYACALRAAELGLSVALVEKDLLGGTCLHRGCIPTKALLHAAEVADAARDAERFGVRATLEGVDLPAVTRYREGVVARLHRGLQGLVRARAVDYVEGAGRLEGPTCVVVGERRLVGRHVVLATGSRARTLPGLDLGDRVVTSDGALRLREVPGRVVVLGGGVIGVEFASLLRSFGAEVTVVEALPRLVATEDASSSAALERAFRRRGITVRTGARFASASEDERAVTVRLEDGTELETDLLLVAVGRAPVTDDLGYEEAGVTLERGFVVTDDHGRTGVEGLWAVGDIVPGPQLAHRGFAQGIAVAERVAGLSPAPVADALLPRVTYSDPEVASVGLTEEQARAEHGEAVETSKYSLGGNGRSQILGTQGFVKLVRVAHGPVVGVHMVGARMGEQVGEAQLVVGWEAHPEDVTPFLHAHPTQNEALGEAHLALAGKPLHAHN
ncbi:dihydrolipoyl dehydrogenase [Phycicoccus endophyticus]|uniref:Dihydrolipoyl dehydrogenase n=1 Tax=Phycicoccus endophyticus TaxID=1690220 RepID=A0A7G9R514_9MICO|nr:dihydrolipoyl dehydrogenase [Phycicoccus endophyticus]NHI20919.1 dihydrolipoyl dehydrogenase [Phycicoccus endophyticus]QNN50689.1 dihydrolipoyl dehydrogenase [Phycicoccus endophyticus]GGL22276.1 dihydrolipoyl dehydrogenase [Phycicoccus endophyticus]